MKVVSMGKIFVADNGEKVEAVNDIQEAAFLQSGLKEQTKKK
jgi:hypothetical protein